MNANSKGGRQKAVNIASWSKNPKTAQLSNFAKAIFFVDFDLEDLLLLGLTSEELQTLGMEDGVRIHCESVEGLVQGLKSPTAQGMANIAGLSGTAAKDAGKACVSEIRSNGRVMFFLGHEIGYCSAQHRAIIEWCIRSKFSQDTVSRDALLDTGDRVLTHNLGKFDAKPGTTSLPKQVFVRILHEIRDELKIGKTPLAFSEVLGRIIADSLDETHWYASKPRAVENAA